VCPIHTGTKIKTNFEAFPENFALDIAIDTPDKKILLSWSRNDTTTMN